MKILLLGGTHEAKAIARALHEQGVTVIYSLAGIVRQPDLPCEVVSGGFSKRGGLAQFVREQGITDIINATHPFAQTMTQTAERVSQQTGTHYWRFRRADWLPTPDDHWQSFADWGQLLRQLRPYSSVFLTQGQLTESMLAALIMHRQENQRFLHRTAVIPQHLVPDWVDWTQGIGPFALDDEIALLESHRIEVLVSKHSGGNLPAKLLAVRQLQIPVLLLERPPAAVLGSTFDSISELVGSVLQQG
ncbi:precorrin-6A/cobalt-precorrin-6A reductase [Leucothrix pacifica]|uniref:Cobalt-precorrin-6A reductase n=1 Tax=Leucothrix pacifica TaxID=1247513 RepID=A0A317CA48_9GAMM|nr:precorrin-6A/cobalt-precorrin-6A reductase [Leucothrix pacifica]PWQ95428.1 cobalt-precorrin-6A reductase [Leucothrix pacifica]